MLGMMKKGTVNKADSILMPFYKSLGQRHLEDYAQIWSLHLLKEIELEKVQRWATRMISSVEGLPYEKKLTKPKLFSVERRCLRGDIRVFKILNGEEKDSRDLLLTIFHLQEQGVMT